MSNHQKSLSLSFDPLDASEHTDATVDSEGSSIDDDSSSRGQISFGAVHVREYERVVGNNPSTAIGVPLELGWGYIQKEAVPIATYESERVRKGNLRMSSITRKNILHNVFGIPEEELREAEKEVQKIRKSREQTLKQGKISAKTGSAVKSFRRNLRRAISMEKIIGGLAAASTSMMIPGMSSY